MSMQKKLFDAGQVSYRSIFANLFFVCKQRRLWTVDIAETWNTIALLFFVNFERYSCIRLIITIKNIEQSLKMAWAKLFYMKNAAYLW